MNLNQIAADIDFVSSCIRSVTINATMEKISDNNAKTFGMDIMCSKPEIQENRKIGQLRMHIFVEVKPDNPVGASDKIDMVLDGKFSGKAGIADDKFLNLLNINGGAALYSIARSKIEALSGLVYEEGKIMLPMINIIQYYQELNSDKE